MKFLLILSLILFVASGYDYTCEGFTTVESCKNSKIQDEENYCCSITFKTDSNEEKIQCLTFPRIISSICQSSKTMALFREFFLFQYEGKDIIPNINNNNLKVQLNCEDFNGEIDLNFLFFSEEEKKFILDQKEHCFEYYYQSTENNMKVSNEICKSGIFTKFTTEAGLKFIFVDINFK